MAGVVFLRYLAPMTLDEADAWGLIIARGMGHLNGRQLIGVRLVKRASSRCEGVQVYGEPYYYCDRPARVALVFYYRGKYYQVPLCAECYRRTVEGVKQVIVKRIDKIAEALENFAQQG